MSKNLSLLAQFSSVKLNTCSAYQCSVTLRAVKITKVQPAYCTLVTRWNQPRWCCNCYSTAGAALRQNRDAV